MTAAFAPIDDGGPSAMMRPARGRRPSRDVEHDVHVVLDEDDAATLDVAQVLDVTQQRLGQRRVHARHGLIEHDERWLDHERASHLEQLPLSTGERPANWSRMWLSLKRSRSCSARTRIVSSCAFHRQARAR